jgi:NTP pyrophosphatase (non-canonical NTP hydrolase)
MLVAKMKNHIEKRADRERVFQTTPDTKILEALGILQEECAEVIQEVSKIRRFGIESISHHTGVSHATTLEMEIGDMLCLIDYLIDREVISLNGLELAKRAKQEKLTKWSKIYE